MPLTIGSKTWTVPGAYGTIEVINLGSVSLPAFNNIIFVGSSRRGLPSTSSATRKSYEFIKSFSSLADAQDFYGSSILTQAFQEAQIGGAGVINLVNVAPLTNGLATVKDNAGTPVTTFDIVPEDKFFGSAGNDISLTISTASSNTTFTIIPPKLTKWLTAYASTTSTWLSPENVEGLAVNQAIKLWDNSASAPQATTIMEIDSTNLKIRIADLPTSAYAASAYARIFLEDTDHQEVATFASTASITDVISFINKGSTFNATRGVYTGAVPTTLTKTYFQTFTGATKGTSPVATDSASGSYDTFAASAGQWFATFTNYTGVRIRILGLLDSAAAEHLVYSGLALTLRTNNQYSIQVVSGCALGDILLSSGTDPITRAKALNSDDFILAGMGYDGKAAYLSLAPRFAGMMSANSVLHNFTNDSISATTVEYLLGASNVDVTAKFLAAGVLVIGTGANFYIVQGINTWQNQATRWTSDGAHTYKIMQRQIVDYVYEGYKTQMNRVVGADGYGPAVASAQGLSILNKYERGGFITDYKMVDAWRDGDAVLTKPNIVPAEETDFVGWILQVTVPN